VTPRTALAAGLLCVAAGQVSAQQAVDYARSSVSFVATQMRVPVDGTFRKYTAEIRWDPAKPEASRASIDIDVASFDMGEESVNAEARGREFFDAAAHPRARFQSTAVKPLGGDRYELAGRVTIKGVTRDVAGPFTVKADGANDVFEGRIPIKRLQFGIGEGAWRDTAVLADEVAVRFRIVTRR
jgi:polyisoprenoid-binding protein YceI